MEISLNAVNKPNVTISIAQSALDELVRVSKLFSQKYKEDSYVVSLIWAYKSISPSKVEKYNHYFLGSSPLGEQGPGPIFQCSGLTIHLVPEDALTEFLTGRLDFKDDEFSFKSD